MFCILLLSVGFARVTAAQETVTIPLEDLKQLRKLAADRDFWKGIADDAKEQITALQASVTNWHGLYMSEKARADGVQENRIAEVKAATKALTDANTELHNQHADDVRKIGEQNAEIIKLKSSRKWYFGTGAAIGAAVGYYIGHNGMPGLPGIANRPANRGFGFKFQF